MSAPLSLPSDWPGRASGETHDAPRCHPLLALGASVFAGCGLSSRRPALPPPALMPALMPLTPFQTKVLAGAKAQIGDAYDALYRVLPYPNVDPPAGEGHARMSSSAACARAAMTCNR